VEVYPQPRHPLNWSIHVNRTLWLLTLCVGIPGITGAQEPIVRGEVISAHTRFLADDLLRGRGTGSEGTQLAALYIESQCRQLGLRPAPGGYRQPVQLEEASILSTTSLQLSRAGGSVDFLYPVDFVPNVGSAATTRGFDGPAVFVGSERDLLTGRLSNLDLRGRVAITVQPIRGEAVDTLVRRGAVGMMQLVPDSSAFRLYVRSRGPTRLYHRDPGVASSFLPALPSLLVGPRVVAALVDGLALTPEGNPFPQPVAWSVRAHVATTVHAVDEDNVVCVFDGTQRGTRDTVIALSAHYDHLGISFPDASGDSIYNGFSDNAAGVGMLLAIAEAITRPYAPAIRHSVLFLFFTGEERGLLGSDAYVATPSWPLERTLALVNLDAGAPPAQPTSWRLAGVDTSGFGAVAIRVATRRGWQITTSPAKANSDYFPFHRSGVPSMFVIPGPAPYEGLSEDSSAALRRRWDRYHQPSDEWDPEFLFQGLQRYASFALDIVREADSTFTRRPFDPRETNRDGQP
jgi:hypothetical protein